MSVFISEGDGLRNTKTTFPGGESCIRIEYDASFPLPKDVSVEMEFESNSDLFDLSLLVDAVRRLYTENFRLPPNIKLLMSYVPYARQDRVCNPGESLSVKVVADFINALNFVGVFVMDPHSDVSVSLFNNLVVTPQEHSATYVAELLGNPGNVVVVAPDAGASKKATKFAKAGSFGGLIQAEKVREMSTGRILETRLNSTQHIGEKDFLIVDDICDGGRTFIELAKVLRPLTDGAIILYVTHGIFSAGTEVFDGVIDKVYTSNPVGVKGNEAVDSGKVTIV